MARYVPQAKLDRLEDLSHQDPEEALEEFRRLLDKYPTDPTLRHNYAVTLVEQGYPALAMKQFELAAPRFPGPEGYMALIKTYNDLGMPIHSLQAARKVRTLGGPDIVKKLEHGLPMPDGMVEKDQLEFEQARYHLLYTKDSKGLEQILRFIQRFPHYRPALNLAATGYADLGQWDQARHHALSALELAPGNAHSLFTLARVELLTHGEEAVRQLLLQHRPQKIAALPDDAQARAQIYALLNDDAMVEQSLRGVKREHWVGERLKERKAGSQRPYFDTPSLLSGARLERWSKLKPKEANAHMRQELLAMPGLLERFPSTLGFESPEWVKLLALMLLDGLGHDPWLQTLAQIVRSGPGELQTRLTLATLLQQRGLSQEELAPEHGGMRLLQLEIFSEPEPWPFSQEEHDTFAEALGQLQAGKYQTSRQMLEPLVQAHPEHPSFSFNLAVAELSDQTLRDGESTAHARLEKLVQEHPTYLFAKAQLAYRAIEEKDLTRARELLKLPEGVSRVHVQEYGFFAAVGGMLALEEGELGPAENVLKTLRDMGEDDTLAYKRLERKITWAKRFGFLFKRRKRV